MIFQVPQNNYYIDQYFFKKTKHIQQLKNKSYQQNSHPFIDKHNFINNNKKMSQRSNKINTDTHNNNYNSNKNENQDNNLNTNQINNNPQNVEQQLIKEQNDCKLVLNNNKSNNRYLQNSNNDKNIIFTNRITQQYVQKQKKSDIQYSYLKRLLNKNNNNINTYRPYTTSHISNKSNAKLYESNNKLQIQTSQLLDNINIISRPSSCLALSNQSNITKRSFYNKFNHKSNIKNYISSKINYTQCNKNISYQIGLDQFIQKDIYDGKILIEPKSETLLKNKKSFKNNNNEKDNQHDNTQIIHSHSNINKIFTDNSKKLLQSFSISSFLLQPCAINKKKISTRPYTSHQHYENKQSKNKQKQIISNQNNPHTQYQFYSPSRKNNIKNMWLKGQMIQGVQRKSTTIQKYRKTFKKQKFYNNNNNNIRQQIKKSIKLKQNISQTTESNNGTINHEEFLKPKLTHGQFQPWEANRSNIQYVNYIH